MRDALLHRSITTPEPCSATYRLASAGEVGQTQGREKLDRQHDYSLPVKDIFPDPLDKSFRRTLLGDPT